MLVTRFLRSLEIHMSGEFRKVNKIPLRTLIHGNSSTMVPCVYFDRFQWRFYSALMYVYRTRVLDLASFNSIRKFAQEYQEEGLPLHILVTFEAFLLSYLKACHVCQVCRKIYCAHDAFKHLTEIIIFVFI
jgi:hypothetical protein